MISNAEHIYGGSGSCPPTPAYLGSKSGEAPVSRNIVSEMAHRSERAWNESKNPDGFRQSDCKLQLLREM